MGILHFRIIFNTAAFSVITPGNQAKPMPQNCIYGYIYRNLESISNPLKHVY